MSSNVGLSTPRGSGTSGYVQRSLSHLKPRDVPGSGPPSSTLGPSRTPDASILRHTRLRAIEAQVFALRDQLEEAETDEDEIDAQCEALRAKLTAEMERNGDSGAGGKLKAHQSHDIAAAKIKEDERLRRALGIRRDYEEGGHWKRREEKERMAQNGGGEAERGVARDAREGERKSSLRKEVERSRTRWSKAKREE
ncbi:hypothetical protein K461DRAFT_266216 [Myriangium duriaei CBS 260.36]|uniref:CWF21 domain-containing protein n=1 Tax=Myriangium duriaei CBS 260.36 TaxID=1168546 RepID=A0A9P4J9F1_9PEZI|nr:hypothetical protein K461DRAFT_266216 [Myriangium duriaei CBS 260.36]